MIRLIYCSKASKLLSNDDLEAMLEKARENNVKKDITGLLVVKGYSFFQWLEGEESSVIELFNKIKDDERHHSVFVMNQENVDNRVFGDWSMGYKNIDKLTDLESNKLKNFSDDWSSEDLPKIFKSFLKSNVL
jgi:hypothetical protein